MNNVLIRFENFNDDKLKGEIKKWCRKLDMPLKRRAVRLFFEDEPKRNKHLLGGSFFCDFALMDRLFPNEKHKGFFSWFIRLPLTIQRFFAAKESADVSQNENSGGNQKSDSNFAKVICFTKAYGNDGDFAKVVTVSDEKIINVNMKNLIGFFAFIDCFIKNFYDPRGLFLWNSNRLKADGKEICSVDKWEKAKLEITHTLDQYVKGIENARKQSGSYVTEKSGKTVSLGLVDKSERVKEVTKSQSEENFAKTIEKQRIQSNANDIATAAESQAGTHTKGVK